MGTVIQKNFGDKMRSFTFAVTTFAVAVNAVQLGSVDLPGYFNSPSAFKLGGKGFDANDKYAELEHEIEIQFKDKDIDSIENQGTFENEFEAKDFDTADLV